MTTDPHAPSPLPASRAPRRPSSRRRLGRVTAAGMVALAALVWSPVAPAAAAPDDDDTEIDSEIDDIDDIDDDGGLTPVTECVIVNGDGTFTAFFGYDNRTGGLVTRPLGGHNRVRGAAGAAPTTFAAGRHVAVFSATTADSRIAWRLGDRDAVATPRSVPCSTNPSMPEAPVTLLLMLAPALVTGWWIRRRQRLVPAAMSATTARPC